MATQPSISGGQPVSVAAAGTTVITTGQATLQNIILPGTFVGSVEWYDSATAAGTAAGNLIYNIGIPLLRQYDNIYVGARVRKGLVVVATGTPTLTYTWD